MIETTVVFAFISASFFLCLAPGPDNLFVMANSLSYGHRAGLAITFGICLGLVIHTLAVALGLAALFQAHPSSYLILKFIGASYLGYLAWQMFQSAPSNTDNMQFANATPSFWELLKRGMIMCLSNPKVLIFFLAFLPQFTRAEESLAIQLMALGGLFILTAATVFGSFAMFTGQVAKRFNQSSKTQSVLNKLAGVVFLAMAMNLLFTELG